RSEADLKACSRDVSCWENSGHGPSGRQRRLMTQLRHDAVTDFAAHIGREPDFAGRNFLRRGSRLKAESVVPSLGDAMRRRDFIKVIGGAVVAWPHAAGAQQGERLRRIGILAGSNENDPATRANFAALREGLAKLG